MAAVAGMHETMTPTAASKMLLWLLVTFKHHKKTGVSRHNIDGDGCPCIVFAVTLIKAIFEAQYAACHRTSTRFSRCRGLVSMYEVTHKDPVRKIANTPSLLIVGSWRPQITGKGKSSR